MKVNNSKAIKILHICFFDELSVKRMIHILQERVLAEKLKYRLGLFSGSIKSIRRQDVNKYGGIMKHFAYVSFKL